MVRPYRADKTPPTVAVETREREVVQESPGVPERDLRHRFDLGEGSLAAAWVARDTSE